MSKNHPHGDEEPEKHLQGKGHAQHRFNPKRAEEFRDPERIDTLRLEELAEKLQLNPGDHLLDLGTGIGAVLPFFSRYLDFGVVLGSDISEDMLDHARQYVDEKDLTNAVLLQNSVDRLPNVDETIDGVLILSSLHEFSDPEAMMGEVERVLRPGGVLGIVEWRPGKTEEGPPVDHRLESDTIHGWFREAGLNPLDVDPWTEGGYDLYRARKTNAR